MLGTDVFKSDGNFIYWTSQYCEFYIPQSFFSSSAGFAEDRGDIIRGIGLFDVGIFSDGKLVEMKTLNIPTWIELYVHESENRDVKLPGSDDLVPCRVLIYYNGAKVMNAKIIEDSSNAELYLKLICAGKIPVLHKLIPRKTSTYQLLSYVLACIRYCECLVINIRKLGCG